MASAARVSKMGDRSLDGGLRLTCVAEVEAGEEYERLETYHA